MLFPHLPLDLSLRSKRRHGVDRDQIHGPGTDQGFGNLQSLFAGIRLGEQQLIHVNSQLLRIIRVQSVLGVNKSGGSAALLNLGDDV